MRTPYVHIGTHKTGSSSIQNFFSANDDAMLRVFRLLYPKSGRSTTGSHHHLVWQAAQDVRYSAHRGSWEALARELSTTKCENALVSCEAFSAYQDHAIVIAPLADLADRMPCDVQPILFVRPQEHYIESLYNEHVKGGGLVDSFPQFVTKELEHPRYNYGKVADAWSNAFRPPTVMTYEDGSDSVRQMVNALRLDLETLTQHTQATERVNERVGATALSLILACTRAGRSLGMTKQKTRAIAARLMQTLSDPDTPARSLDEKTAVMIRERFAEFNRQFAKKYLGRNTLFQDNNSAAKRESAECTLMNEATMARLESAFRCIMARDNSMIIEEQRSDHRQRNLHSLL